MEPLFGTPFQKYNSDKVERVPRRAARFVKSKYSRYSSVSDMLDVLGWDASFSTETGGSIYSVLQNYCPSKASLLRRIRKHNMKI